MSLSPGTRLGPYEVTGQIGQGGMGEVYRARDPRLEREVAVKVCVGLEKDDPDRLRRFELEARAAGNLNHPNVLAIYDIGYHDETPYIVSELLEGAPLDDRLRDGPLPPHKVVDYAAQIAAGLGAAHAKGIVHRDLKPANLFLTTDGRVKILDFGLAKTAITSVSGDASQADTRVELTQAGMIVGTVSYMSPEQVRSRPLDGRSDLFAFGAVLHEMLTGRSAFRRTTSIETMHATLTEDPTPIPDGTRVPAGLELILRRCLEKSPDERFQSARDLEFALTALSGQIHVLASRTAAPPGHRVSLRRLAPVAALLASVLAVGAAFVAGQRTNDIRVPSFQQLTFRRGFVQSARFAPDGSTVIYGAAWDGEPIRLFSTRVESPESSPLGIADGDILSISASGQMAVSLGRAHVLGWATSDTLAQVPLNGGGARELLTDVEDADWGPDGDTLAVAHIVDGRHRLEYPIGTVLYEGEGWINHVRVSPDGGSVAFLDHPVPADDRGHVSVVDLDGNKRDLSTNWASVNGLDWSPDGAELWFTAAEVGQNCELHAVDLSGRRRLLSRTAGRLGLQDVAADGRLLLTDGEFRFVMSLKGVEDERARDLTWLGGSVAAQLSQDGRSVFFNEMGMASGTASYAVYSRSIDGEAPVRLGDGFTAALSPDGRWVATIATGPPSRVMLLPTGAGEPHELSSSPLAEVEVVTWLADSTRLLVEGREAGRDVRLYILDVEGGTPTAVSPEGMRIPLYSSPVSPSGDRVVALDADERLVLLPLDGTGPPAVLAVEPGNVPIQWTSDGEAVYLYRRAELPATVVRYSLAMGGGSRLRSCSRRIPPGRETSAPSRPHATAPRSPTAIPRHSRVSIWSI